MTYPPPGGTPDPYQPQQPYGQQPSYDPYSQDPYAAPASGAPSSGQPYGQQSPYGAPSSGQPYGQQQYAQPGYGQPYAQQPYAPMPAPTNTMAILSLVFAFVFPLAGVIMGHVAKKQIRNTGESGEGLATAGLWLSYIFVAIGLVLCAFYVVVVIFAIGSSSGTTTY
ncbi:hypothetical protein Asp14428_53790 [Actinoplanes sp. NBRC 14428]|uniref:Uncharacterized protein DUF4190 n=1 Tax=Pseudosporangium ferrugineum TaxID=439699 RepID=A0A2T0S4W3_9ACTN|nr:DUF4190 domain-containing protein [Pseudosporangium ferrugineum]PRY28459.1 uncharacterized protein DUF4190 [Pseudosporangium ferrugineum]BCJ53904.1 hypothetical protein Asp14428_53790 [Actinoplanes sp. NBRC 14428]